MRAAMGLLPLVIAFAVASAACLLVVVWQMARHEDVGKAFLGLVTVAYAFLWGWQNSDRVRFKTYSLGAVMTLWSWCMGTAFALYAIMGDKL
jgi:hypothetical protein